MYVAVIHRFIDPAVAFSRGEKLITNEGAPTGAHGLEFYPARSGWGAICLWESPSVESIQRYVDSTLGDASENTCFEVESEQAFASQPLGIREAPARV